MKRVIKMNHNVCHTFMFDRRRTHTQLGSQCVWCIRRIKSQQTVNKIKQTDILYINLTFVMKILRPQCKFLTKFFSS